MRLWVLALPLFLLAAAGTHPRSGVRAGPSTVGEPFVRCSQLADPAVSTTALTTATSASDLHADIMAVCGSGCIVTLGPGTYTGNVVFGDSSLKSGSITPTGEVVIRASDPRNPPVIRATLGLDAGVIHAKDVTARIRLEDLILDGRRSEQTSAVISTICTDTTPADGICDGSGNSNQSSTNASGFYTRSTLANGATSSCLLRVQARETVSTGLHLRQATNSTVEGSTVTGAGCTTASCPLMSIPGNTTSNAVMKTAQGVQLEGTSSVDSTDSAVVDSTITDVTKIGIECYTNVRRCHIRNNTISRTGIDGINLDQSDGDIIGNSVTTSGLAFSPNALTDNVGQGITWANGSTYTGLVTRIEGNSVSNTFGAGIQIGLFGGAYNDARFEVVGNSVSGACNGTTRTDAAGIELGDSTYDVQQVMAIRNSVTSSGCADGFRVRNVRKYRGVSNSSTTGVEVDAVDLFDSALDAITGNFDIDATTKGKLVRCTIVSGSIVGAAGMARVNC